MSSLINKLNFTFCNKLPVVIDEAIDINLLMYASETRSGYASETRSGYRKDNNET